MGDAVAEGLGKLLAYLVLFAGDYHSGLCLVEALDDEVNGLDGCAVGDYGVKRKYEITEDTSRSYVKHGVIYHNEVADGKTKTLCKNDRHNFNAVDCAAEANGKTAAHA